MQSQLDRRVSDVENAVFKEGEDRTEAQNQ